MHPTATTIPLLREYQLQAIEQIRQAFRERKKRVVFQLPTGAGKTILFSYMVAEAARRGKRVLIVAHRVELIEQISAALDSFRVDHGTVLAGQGQNGQPVQVGMVQTLRNRLKKGLLQPPDFLVIDECVDGMARVITDIGHVRLRDLPGSGASAVLSFDGERPVFSPFTAWKNSGERDCISLRLSDGQSITCTSDHLLFSEGKWIAAGRLCQGQKITALAHADAGQSLRAASGDGSGLTFSDTSPATDTRRSTGKPGSLNMPPLLRSALAAVANRFWQTSPALAISRRGAPKRRAIGASPTATTSDRPRSRSSSPRKSGKPFSERCSATGRSDCPTHARSIPGSPGRTARRSGNGSSTRLAFWLGWTRASRSPATPATAKPAFAWLPRACLAWMKSATLLCEAAARSLQSNGSIAWEISGSRGGFATTDRLPAAGASTFTPKDIRKNTTRSSATGSIASSAARRFTPMAAATSLSPSLKGPPPALSSASLLTSLAAWRTRSAEIVAISSSRAEVFDITVPGTHCFFADGVLVHNCHHCCAPTYRDLIEAYPQAHLLGVTATPARTDRRGLGEIYGHMVCGPSVRWLIDNKYLAEFRMFGPPDPIEWKTKKIGGEYNRAGIEEETEKKIWGNPIDHCRQLAPGSRFVCFANSVAAAKNWAAAFTGAGIPTLSLDGAMDKLSRADVIDQLRSGAIQGVTSCDLISEGFDLPALETAILLRPTASLIVHLQQLGRVLRPAPGKIATIIDHVDNLREHGAPDDEHKWTLDGVDPKPPRQSDDEEDEQERGGRRVLGIEDAKLQGLTQQDIKRWRQYRLRMIYPEADTLPRLRLLQQVREYKDAWLVHRAREQGYDDRDIERVLGWTPGWLQNWS